VKPLIRRPTPNRHDQQAQALYQARPQIFYTAFSPRHPQRFAPGQVRVVNESSKFTLAEDGALRLGQGRQQGWALSEHSKDAGWRSAW
ncbi:hypothetical protein JZU56_01710, partial [bacterium]|nr:hypothetical protein [bacterium]